MSNTLPADPKRSADALSQRGDAGDDIGDGGERAETWLAENRAALESSNAFVAKHGLPLTPIWVRHKNPRREHGDTTPS